MLLRRLQCHQMMAQTLYKQRLLHRSFVQSTSHHKPSSSTEVAEQNPARTTPEETEEDAYVIDPDTNPQAVASYFAPIRLPSKYGIPVCTIHLRSYHLEQLEFFADFVMRAAYYARIPASGPVPLPKRIERWTVPKSPFVFAKNKENFERITYKRCVQLKDGHHESVSACVNYIADNMMAGIGMKVQFFAYEQLGSNEELMAGSKELFERLTDKLRETKSIDSKS